MYLPVNLNMGESKDGCPLYLFKLQHHFYQNMVFVDFKSPWRRAIMSTPLMTGVRFISAFYFTEGSSHHHPLHKLLLTSRFVTLRYPYQLWIVYIVDE